MRRERGTHRNFSRSVALLVSVSWLTLTGIAPARVSASDAVARARAARPRFIAALPHGPLLAAAPHQRRDRDAGACDARADGLPSPGIFRTDGEEGAGRFRGNLANTAKCDCLNESIIASKGVT
ncbi:hypothetical protein HPB47_010250 [Ixodes persulcatus]|uniref:Uncharacterized protein n=1 Tax=Ixodes persulcatus TaxID=34615 RepID=A0AC60NZN6_IXOPE|nr:hypothetical protein HPB47_010250 [Ixodes persulcatus]